LVKIVEWNIRPKIGFFPVHIVPKDVLLVRAELKGALLGEALTPDREKITQIELVRVRRFDMKIPIGLMGVDDSHALWRDTDPGRDRIILSIESHLKMGMDVERKILVLCKVDAKDISVMRLIASKEHPAKDDNHDDADAVQYHLSLCAYSSIKNMRILYMQSESI
jgi:hypothetical protein